jgi:tRNA(fMet)-specific endonuclease VapC
MILLDTDTISHLLAGHLAIAARFRAIADEVAITIVSRIEILEGRFAFVMKAADGAQALRAQQWLAKSEGDLARFRVIPFDDEAGATFDRLLGTKGLRRIGRGDLLNASIALSRGATLVTRNLKDYRKFPGLRLENWAD